MRRSEKDSLSMKKKRKRKKKKKKKGRKREKEGKETTEKEKRGSKRERSRNERKKRERAATIPRCSDIGKEATEWLRQDFWSCEIEARFPMRETHLRQQHRRHTDDIANISGKRELFDNLRRREGKKEKEKKKEGKNEKEKERKKEKWLQWQQRGDGMVKSSISGVVNRVFTLRQGFQ